ncbi:MAG: ParA family protein [Bacteroidales bacterium]|jgi:cellulose biosynthesis protein BcsQ|nr:ParA family protein [Bacteroidales bacterium]
MERITFWNNKGGTGKTSLAFQTICEYANQNSNKKILIIDVCPQANLSELLLGGLYQGGSKNLFQRQSAMLRATIGGYFQLRLPSPYSPPNFNAQDFLTKPNTYNPSIPKNIDLLCGDPLLELQSNAISTLANNNIPTINSWISVIDWLNDFLKQLESIYDIVFFDLNPSFSIYTQIALAATSKLVLPVMADDSSRRAIQNAFSLIYGIKLPSEIYTKYAFAEKLKEAGRELPKVHMIIKNRLTQYMGAASAFATVLKEIDRDVSSLIGAYPDIFSFTTIEDGVVEVRDFNTAGIVSTARGCPFYSLNSGRLDLLGKRVQVKEEFRQKCMNTIKEIVSKSFAYQTPAN